MVAVELPLGVKPQCRKTKYNPKVYSNLLLLISAVGASTLSQTSKYFSDSILNV